jgi:hypothetical protein
MKLGEVARLVVAFLRAHPEQEFTANTLLMHLGLPLKEKRRLYDVIEVLASVDRVSIRKDARKRHFYYKPEDSQDIFQPVVLDLPENPVFQEEGTIIQLLIKLGPTAFQELSNMAALKMIERDIKRAIFEANAVSITRITLQNNHGRVMKEAMTTAVPAVS